MGMKHIRHTFSREVTALGRNGVMKQQGILLDTFLVPKAVTLYPENSRGDQGRCFLQIPLEDLPAVIEQLKTFVNE